MSAIAAPSRLPLAHLPTPLERVRRFSTEVGAADIWIKRDDCTGLGLGGSKARKLEYLMAAARQEGADTIVTFGGVQSNHTRMTAAAARRLGMDCHLIIAGSPPAEATGNLLLSRVLGATFTFLSLTPSELTPGRVQEAFSAADQRLRSAGRRPYLIGPGGSTPLGALGYRDAFEEMLTQAEAAGLKVAHVVVSFGTGGTLAGLLLGNLLAGRPVTVTGVSAAPPGMPESLGVPPIAQIVSEAASLVGREALLRDDDVRVRFDDAGRVYAAPTAEGMQAIRGLARSEGIFLDPVYTGKAMAGLLGMCRRKEILPHETVVFFHTGGTPALFAYGGLLST